MSTYFNTTNLTGSDLRTAVAAAIKQEDAILLIYKHTRKEYSPSVILALMHKAGHNLPLTSVRRAITNLCDKGELVKTSKMVEGNYGKPEHSWQLNFIRYPSKIAEQKELF